MASNCFESIRAACCLEPLLEATLLVAEKFELLMSPFKLLLAVLMLLLSLLMARNLVGN